MLHEEHMLGLFQMRASFELLLVFYPVWVYNNVTEANIEMNLIQCGMKLWLLLHLWFSITIVSFQEWKERIVCVSQ